MRLQCVAKWLAKAMSSLVAREAELSSVALSRGMHSGVPLLS